METKEKTAVERKKRPPAAQGKARGTKNGTATKPRQTPKRAASGRTAARTSSGRKPAAPARQPRTAERQPSPDVVYVQPAPFNRGRFILCIGIVVAVVLAVVFGMAIFFKVGSDKSGNPKVLVSGANKYTPAQIVEASGIKAGDNLFLISNAQVSSRIQENLRYVDRVRVGIKLPDTVKIEIVELAVVYSVEDNEGGWWLLRSDGRVVEKTNSAEAQQHTQILGIQITNVVEGEPAEAWMEEESSVYPSEKLGAACDILRYLEEYGVIGELTSVDVANIGDIQLKYGEKYKILLGDTSELSAKIRILSGILQSGKYKTGILDIRSPDRVEGRIDS